MVVSLIKFCLFFLLLFTILGCTVTMISTDRRGNDIGLILCKIADVFLTLSWFPLIYLFLKYHW